MKQLIFLTILFSFYFSVAEADLLKDFDSLGGNDILLNKAKSLAPDKKISIVQNRIVDRTFRHELSAGYGSVFGGESFLETQNLKVAYNFHINPKFSVGFDYFQAFNTLSLEGEALIVKDGLIPDLDHLKTGYNLNVNWYPIYGKFNLYDMGIVHFDFYALASYGQVELSSGGTGAYSGGVGLGLWFSKHLTSRLELKQLYYESLRDSGPTDIDLTVGSISMGYLF